MSTLTNHKKGVRAVACNPREFSFASASADNIKVGALPLLYFYSSWPRCNGGALIRFEFCIVQTWRLPEGVFMRNLSGHNVIVNSLSVNDVS